MSQLEHKHASQDDLQTRVDWDRVGIGLSALCVLHCILTPVVLILIPALGVGGELAATEVFHWVMAGLLLPVALIAFWRGYRHHRALTALVLGFSGVMIIYVGLFLPEASGGLNVHLAVNIFGSSLLLTGHVLNRRYCRQCDHTHDS